MLPIALAACQKAQSDPRREPPLVRAMTPTAEGSANREFTGVVAARVQSDLGFRVGGKVIERLVDAGQVVRRGQPLMRIDQTDFALATRASQETVQAARARAVQTAADERRLRDLVSAGAVSASTYDQAKAAADSARAQLAAAEAQARISRNEANYSVLIADADGTVVETLAEPGQVVAAGQIVVRLARSGPREALVQLPETVRPAIGSTADARTYSGQEGTARLRQLSDAADPATRTFEARYVLDGAAARAPLGSTVTVALSQPGESAATVVPLGAIHDAGKGSGVWVIKGNSPATITWRPVRISGVAEEAATITSGLKADERVVAMGAHMLHQGQAVRIAAPVAGAAR
ncbi:efflux RND transporter periplasmic adaptor subunit [Sphingobium terrigena]|uniref:Efflux RND transporter periplasmic adaptor subunit n=1 Tax=Sphingobium terrigena TaxID=2304063 RepID=A0A418YYR1_9SPHN|nr:efflux RND transporter periplasmic adaptor subunit [Sphingobium terrigena]RJG58001.1 efflux RND transporter periplasmic adaptor subunit [Sphingobium terrigena]